MQTVEKLTLIHNTTETEKVLAVQGIFVEIGLKPNSEFVKNLAKLNRLGEIVVDCRTKTSIPGLFAVGDVNRPGMGINKL